MSVQEAPAEAPAGTRRSPYQGLVPYTEADAEWFFGRDEWCEVIGDNFRAYRIVVLYGASGVGKSSVLRAGLIRQLRDEARENVSALDAPRLLPVHFSAWSLDDPLAALRDAVRTAGEEVGQEPLEEQSLTGFLSAWPARVGGPLLLVLDQLEELFVYHDRPGDSTLEELTAALRNRDPAVHFLLALREDSLAKLDRFEGHVPGLLDHLLRLDHLDRDDARHAIVEPLARWNTRVAGPGEDVEAEPALVEAVLDQVEAGRVSLGERGPEPLDGRAAVVGVEAPYLQLVLDRLWDEERTDGSRLLRLQTLDRLGGATVIVRTHLDAALAALPARDQNLAGRTLPYLVTPSGTKIAHRVGDLAAYARVPEERLQPLVEQLAGDVRILRPAGDGRFEIYHDALAGPILDWNARWEAHEKRRRERRRMGIVGAIALVLAAIAVAIAILAIQARHAKNEARLGQSRALAAQAVATADTDPSSALRAAVQSAEVAPTSDADSALRVALASNFLRQTLRGVGSVAAFSPRGKLIVTSGTKGSVRLWDAATGRTLHILRGHRGFVSSAVFSPEEDVVVTAADDGTARIWEVGSGKPLHVLRANREADEFGRRDVAVSSQAFSPDGKAVVTAGGDGAARIWDVVTGRAIHVLRGGVRHVETDVAGAGRLNAIQDAAFSPDGKRVVTAGADGTARIWDAASGRRLHILRHPDGVTGAAFDPDGKRVLTVDALPGDGAARIWDAASGRRLRVLSYQDGGIETAAFSPNGKLVVTADLDGTARIWSAARGRTLRTLSGNDETGLSASAAFSPDGKLVVTTANNTTARIWETASGANLRVLRGHEGTVDAAAFSPDGKRIVTAGNDGTARIWDAAPGGSVKVLRRGDVANAASSPDGKWVFAAGYDETPWLWDTATGRHRVLRGHRDLVATAAFSPDSKLLVTAGDDRTARIWSVAGGPSLHTLRGHRRAISSVTFSPDGKLIVTTSKDGTARIWNVAGGPSLHTLRGHRSGVSSAAFSPDGKLVVTTGDDATARIWETASGRDVRVLRGHRGPVFGAAFSPDGKLVVTTGKDGTVRIWETAGERGPRVLRGNVEYVSGVTFSPDGKLVLTAGGDGTARLWETASGRSLHVLRGHLYPVASATFTRDGRIVLTAGRDGTARLWDAASGRSLDILRGHTFSLTGAAFAANDRLIVTAAEDGTARIWNCDLCGLSIGELLARAKERIAAA